jgi:hypothetical protein
MPSLPTDDAIVRLVGAFPTVLEPMAHNGSLLETNDAWAVAGRYVSLETLACVTNTATVGCPPWPPEPRPNLSEARRSDTTIRGITRTSCGCVRRMIFSKWLCAAQCGAAS